MAEIMVKIVNAETGEEIERPANADELAQFEIDKANIEAEKLALAEQVAARSELLNRLGITEDEAKLLLA